MSTSNRKQLIERIVEDFAPRHARLPQIWITSHSPDRMALASFGIDTEASEPLPDVVIHDQERDWLFLVDIPSRNRRMDQARYEALTTRFDPCGKHLVIFSAYTDSDRYCRSSGSQDAIAWGTHVWIAETPAHMIHYGQQFRGPMSAAC